VRIQQFCRNSLEKPDRRNSSELARRSKARLTGSAPDKTRQTDKALTNSMSGVASSTGASTSKLYENGSANPMFGDSLKEAGSRADVFWGSGTFKAGGTPSSNPKMTA
jgi:hypothetical protein